jgi:hypothetical protein
MVERTLYALGETEELPEAMRYKGGHDSAS